MYPYAHDRELFMSLLRALRWPYHIPSHLLNGVSVALGITLVVVIFNMILPHHPAQWLFSGAVFASLADVPTTVERSWRRVAFSGLFGAFTAGLIALLRSDPGWLGLAIMFIAFAASMTLVWGPRAGPIAFSPILAMVFTLAQPVTPEVLPLLGWHLAGVAIYLVWAICMMGLLQARYRSLALARSVQALVQLLEARARTLNGELDPRYNNHLRRTWIKDEAVLAERLQAARDLLFSAPDSPRAKQESALLLRIIELRDTLLASKLDLDLLGEDHIGTQIRASLASRLREMAVQLSQTEAVTRGIASANDLSPAPSEEKQHYQEQHTKAIFDVIAASMTESDLRLRLLPVLVDRLIYMERDIERIRSLLRSDQAASLPLSRCELQLFVAPEGWSLNALRQHATLASPIMRHALRSAAALGVTYYLALILPWTSHPQWLVLSVAVVLRGNLEQTLSRRNQRVLGTALGCLLVLGLSYISAYPVLMAAFLVAVGIAHSFVLERYLVTAAAATVMALMQGHIADPSTGFPVLERLADTFLGALIAWGFCFMLPSWERRSLPKTLQQTLAALRNYATQALRQGPDSAVAQRLARRQAYDAVAGLAWILQRSRAEPKQVRVPVAELTILLDHAQRLMAHLLVVRLSLLRRAHTQDPQTLENLLQQADGELQTALTPIALTPMTTPLEHSPADDPTLEMLPTEPPSTNMLPWLERRLRVAIQDSYQVAQAAQAAQQELEKLT